MVPVSVIADNAWLFNSWDRFLLPKPFSRVTIRYGNMMPVEMSDDADAVETHRKNLENVMRPGLYS